MASGTPDYYQTVRESYGAATWSWGLKTVTANAATNIITKSGKGVIYGGSVTLDPAASQKGGIVSVVVDGWILGANDFEELNKFNQVGIHDMPAHLRMYDEINFRYCVAISSGITFEESLDIIYNETQGRTPDVTGMVYYALMQ